MQARLPSAPAKPGVYLFKDGRGRVLYVGKAKDLRNRLRSYFQKSSGLDARKEAMVAEVRDLEFTVTANELEAFVLEANLIKQYKPRYNVLLRDDKSYPYLKLTLNETWPRLEVVRRIARDGARYYGPYVPSGPMWKIVSFVRNTYHIRTCSYALDRRMRPCIQHQIKRCVAPCSGEVDRDEYMKMVEEVRLLLEGRNKGLLASLQRKMQRLSDELQYEEAALVRDRIEAIRSISEFQKAVAPGLGDLDIIGLHREGGLAVFKMLFVRSGIMIGSRHFMLRDTAGEADGSLTRDFIGRFYDKEFIPPPDVISSILPEEAGLLAAWLSQRRRSAVRISRARRGIKRQLADMAVENARIILAAEGTRPKSSLMHELASFLGLRRVPADAGAFDISNISGSEPVGAFVYWEGGHFRKERYRHTRMDEVAGPDDYAMMREMIRRTAVSLGGELPDLLIIDGGKGHLEAALEALAGAGPTGTSGSPPEVIAVAKDPDRVFLTGGGSIDLEEGNPAALLLRRIRDEVHRFAIRYHKKRRAERSLSSPLERVPGIGRQRHFALLRHFGSIEAIRSASVEEIASVKGLNRKVAEAVKKAL